MILQVLTHCLQKLPNLHVLQLSVHFYRAEQEDLLPLLDDMSCTTIKNFLSFQGLRELDLTGLTRDIPLVDLLQGSGASLQSLRLHVDGPKKPLALREDTPIPDLLLGETAFLDADKLDYLNHTCPYLEHLGLDVECIEDVPVIILCLGT